MDFTFTATEQPATKAPFYEDARADFAPYYRSKKTIKAAQAEVAAELAKLGGAIVAFREGYFGQTQRRYGYEIEFVLYDKRGVLRVAGLPIRSYNESAAKIQQVRVQALLNVRDWLKATITQQVFQPQAGHPLMMHLFVDDRRTVADYIAQSSRLPALSSGENNEVVDGEFTER